MRENVRSKTRNYALAAVALLLTFIVMSGSVLADKVANPPNSINGARGIAPAAKPAFEASSLTLTTAATPPVTPTNTPTPTPTCPPGGWLAATPVPTGVWRYAFVQDGNDFYEISGDTITNAVRRYNAATDSWANLAPVPYAIQLAEAVLYDGKIYVVGGFPVSYFQVYDIQSDTWTTATLSFAAVGPAVGEYNGAIYVAGGFSNRPGNTQSTNLAIYNIASSSWLTIPNSLPAPYVAGGFTQSGRYLYAVGGFGNLTLAGPTSPKAPFNAGTASSRPAANGTATMRLDMTTNEWVLGSQWTPARADFGLALAHNKLYAMGGTLNNGGYSTPSNEVDELDLSAWPDGAWIPSPPFLPTARYGNNGSFYTTTRVGGEIWSLGGAVSGGPLLANNLYRSVAPCVAWTPTLTPTRTPCPACPTITPTLTQTSTSTPTLSPTRTPTITPTFTITPIPIVCEQVQWTNKVNVTALDPGNTIQKTGGASATWDAGAISTRALLSADGYVQATVDVTGTYQMFGLSNGDTNQAYGDIDFALYMAGTSLKVYEGGVYRGDFGTITPGDVLRVAVEGNRVNYYRNGTVLYTSSATPTYPLLLDTSINSTGGKVYNAYICGQNLGSNATNTPTSTFTPTNTPTPTSTFTSTFTPTNTYTPLCGLAWNLYNSPSLGTGYNFVVSVAAVSFADVWAVGYYDTSGGHQALIEHWDGSQWSIVPGANTGASNNYLNAIKVVSANDIWADGYYNGGNGDRTLIEHWNGSQWSLVSSPNVGAGNNRLFGISVVSATDVWVSGYSCNSNCLSGSLAQTLVEHWDGVQWSIVGTPNVGTGNNNYLVAIAALSSSDVWASGYYNGCYGCAPYSLTLHWNGAQWSVVNTPHVGAGSNVLVALSAISSNDVWALGSYYTDYLQWNTMVLHWDGAQWSVVTSPNVARVNNQIQSVAAVSANDIWAVGSTTLDSAQRTLAMHWDGLQWSLLPTRNSSVGNSALNGVAALAGDNVWAVGTANTRTLIERYNNWCVTPTATITPGGPTLTVTNSPTRIYTRTSTSTPTFTNTPTPVSIISGHLTWQGITQPDISNTQVTGTLALCNAEAPVTYTFIADSRGNFTVTTNLRDGIYHWYTKGGRHVSSNSPTGGAHLVISGGHAIQEFGTQRGGDTNGDNLSNALDFNSLRTQFALPDGEYSGDFDYNLRVNASDFNMLKQNFNLQQHSLVCP